MNKHLELLQWCIENSNDDFKANYNYSIGKSWISGTVDINCIDDIEVDGAIKHLKKEKLDYSHEKVAEKRKTELLAELETLNVTLSS